MDDDGQTSGKGFLWYEVGRSDGYASGKNVGYHHGADDALYDRDRANQRAGLVTVSLQAINELAANRDEILAEGNALARRVEWLEERINLVTAWLGQSKQREDEFRGKHRTDGRYHSAVEESLRILLKACEQGKTNYPEYRELKACLQKLYDAWYKDGTNLCTPDTLGPTIAALWRALEK